MVKVLSVTLAAATDLGVHGHFERRFVLGRTGITDMTWLTNPSVVRIEREGKTSLVIPLSAIQAFEVVDEVEIDALSAKRGPGRPPKKAA